MRRLRIAQAITELMSFTAQKSTRELAIARNAIHTKKAVTKAATRYKSLPAETATALRENLIIGKGNPSV